MSKTAQIIDILGLTQVPAGFMLRMKQSGKYLDRYGYETKRLGKIWLQFGNAQAVARRVCKLKNYPAEFIEVVVLGEIGVINHNVID